MQQIWLREMVYEPSAAVLNKELFPWQSSKDVIGFICLN